MKVWFFALLEALWLERTVAPSLKVSVPFRLLFPFAAPVTVVESVTLSP